MTGLRPREVVDSRIIEDHAARMVRIKRISASPVRQDGLRILVDRIWPRGVSKSMAQLTNGGKSSPQVPHSANGSDTIL